MLRILFWNTAKNDVLGHLEALCAELKPEIVVIAESASDNPNFATSLTKASGRIYLHPERYGGRIHFATTLARERFIPLHDSNTLSLRRVVDPFAGDILLAAVHLPSKVAYGSEDQAMFSVRLATEVRTELEKHGDIPAIIVGDFNMNPFEVGMVGSEGFHALMDREIVRRGSRVIQGEERKLYYNPIWGNMGDTSEGPPGTCFFPGSTPVSYFWNTFDQVLVSHHLIDTIECVRILTNVGGVAFAADNGHPNKADASDHFPIYFELQTNRLLL